jgi:quercetin dioxygenase-like cupin family protein
MTEEQIKDRMKAERYLQIDIYDDPANEVFPDHDHPGDQLLVVQKGSIAVNMDGKDFFLKPGEEIFFPAKRRHSAQVGAEGCLYIVGERPSDG